MARPDALNLCAGTLLTLAGTAHANLLSNGSFENGAFNPSSNQTLSLGNGSTSITGWTVDRDVLAWIGIGNPFGLSATDGDRFLDLTDYSFGAPFGGIAQTIATTAGSTYSLTFDLGSSNRWGRPSALTASAGGTSATFASPTTGGNDDWQSVTMNFVAAGSSTTIALHGAGGQNYIGLDNVSVDLISSVPEPSSWAMSLVGLIGLAAVAGARRRRIDGDGKTKAEIDNDR